MRYIYIPRTLQPLDCDTLRNLQSKRYWQYILAALCPSRLYVEQGIGGNGRFREIKRWFLFLKGSFGDSCVEIFRGLFFLSLFPLFLFLFYTSHTLTMSREEKHHNACPSVNLTLFPVCPSIFHLPRMKRHFTRAIRGRTGTTVSFCLIPRLRHETLVSNIGARRWDLASFSSTFH